jgi:hypothetical protein
MAGAWIMFLFLRSVGRRHMARPSIPDEIKRVQQEGRGDPDYYI